MEKWEEAARTTILGPKHELEALPGYWFTPRKFPCEIDDRIAVLMRKFRSKKPQAEGEATASPSEVLDSLEAGDVSEVMALSLLGGIGEHAFLGADGKPEAVNESFVHRIMDYSPLATEMMGVIQEWNRPLAPKPSESSEKSSA